MILGLVGATACTRETTVAPRGSTAVPLDPARDGFGFGNFAASDTEEIFDAGDLRSMFGAGVDICLYGDARSCEPTAEAAAFARMVNLARSGGHCEGLVVRAAELFAQSPPEPTSELDNDGEVTHGIIRRFATQLFAEVRAEAALWNSRDLRAIVATLQSALAAGVLSHTMGLYTQSGGHAVLPYEVQWRSESVARIGVYDPNWPGEKRHVDVDVAADRWRFSFSAENPDLDARPWTGGSGTMDLVSLAARDTRRCPFCGEPTGSEESAGAVLLVRSAGSQWSVRTRAGVLTAGAETEIAGTVRPVRADSGSVRDHLVDLPASTLADADGRFTLEIDSATRVSMLLPEAIVEVDVAGDAAPVTVTVRRNGVETSGGTARVAVARGFLGLVVTGTEINLDHAPDAIAATHRSDGRMLRVAVDPDTKTNDASLAELSADLTPELERPTDFPGSADDPAPPTTQMVAGPEDDRAGAADAARIQFDVSEWTLPDDDPASFGFLATDVVAGRPDETVACRSISCLRRRTVWVPRGGYDARDGAVVLSPYEFVLDGSRIPVEIRCGVRGPWVASETVATGQRASCRIDNVTADATIGVRPG